MNPLRRSALALAATCGAVTLASVVDAAPTDHAPNLNPFGETPGASNDPESCAGAATTTNPPTSEPAHGFGAETTTTTSDPANTTLPSSTTTTVPASSVPATSAETTTTVPVDSVDTTTTTAPVTCEPSSTTTTAPPAPAPTTTVLPVDGTGVATQPPTPAPPTEPTAVEPPPSAPPSNEASTGEASTGEVPTGAGSVEEAVAALPVDNGTWVSDGSIRLRSPRDPGASLLEPGRTPAVERSVLVDDVELILMTIRQMESGGRYTVGPNRALASGAYQYIPSTWNNYGGYSHAFLAPPEVQDARARADVIRFLSMYDGDVSMVPVMWYYPRAATDASWMDRVPSPGSGNRLTIRDYQTRWLDRLASNATTLLGTYVASPSAPAAVTVVSDLPVVDQSPTEALPPDPVLPEVAALDGASSPAAPQVADPSSSPAPAVAPAVVLDAVTVADTTVELATRSLPPDGDVDHGVGAMRTIVFPVLGPSTYSDGWGDDRDGGLRRHEGTDIVGVQMQPILAAVDGVVSRYQPASSGIRGVAVTITDVDGWRYNYFHNNDDSPGTDDGQSPDAFRLAPGVQFGDDVVAGQIIGYLGDSGNAEQSVTHLHFELRDPSGVARPSYWSLRAAEARQACSIGIGEWSTPSLADPLPIDPDVVVPIVDPAIVDPAIVVPIVDPATTPVPPPIVEHTVVTPLFGEGQWIIDSAGRVTATGDAALVIPRRDLECDAGPSVPFGTDGAGWRHLDDDVLEGTVLAGVDLVDTVLDGVVPLPADPGLAEPDPALVDPSATDPALIAPAVLETGTETSDGGDPIGEPMVFTDPSTGETIIVVFDVPHSRPDLMTDRGLR